jgi:HK97 family phage major capsid protein
MLAKELRQKAARIVANARSKFDEITDSTPAERAAEIEREHDAMMVEHDQIIARAERLERLETAESRARQGDDRRPRGEDGHTEGGQDDAATVSYRQAFARMLMAGADMSALDSETRTAIQAGFNREVRVQTAGTNAAGGFTVPVELATFIDRAMAAWGPMYDDNICTVINNGRGNEIGIPTIDDTAKTGAIKTEGVAVADDGSQDVVVGRKVLNAFTYDTEFVKFSMELASDSDFNWEQLLGQLLGERLGRLANSALTIGTGTNEPNGIVTAAALGKTAASATAITSDEILDFVHSVDPAYRSSPKARVMFNDTTLLLLRKLKDGQGNYLITEAPDGSGRLRVGAVSVPYSINQAMASPAATARTMVFGDFSRYYVRKAGGPMIGVLRERFWPDLGIAGLIRLDGEIGVAGPIKYFRMA